MSATGPAAQYRSAPRVESWSAPECPFIVEYDLEVFAEIARELDEARTAGAEPLEAGGLLLGTFDGERLRIVDYESVPCEHAFGPAYRLSPQDENALRKRLAEYAADPRSGHVVVGWYQSHLHADVNDEDRRIYDRYFPEPWQIFLLERPSESEDAQPDFVFRTSGADTPQKPASKRKWLILASIVAALCALAVAWFYPRRPPPPPPSHLAVEVAKRNGLIQVTWDRASMKGARSGVLEVQDGANHARIPLDQAMLVSGQIAYSERSDVIRFHLVVVEEATGKIREGSTTLVQRTPIAPPDSAVAAQRAPEQVTATAAQLHATEHPDTNLESPAATPEREVQNSPKPAPTHQTEIPELTGRWVIEHNAASSIESGSIVISESKGKIGGRLEALYHSRSGTDTIHFSFSCDLHGAAAKCLWPSVNGGRGEITLNRVPTSPDLLEVSWHAPGSKWRFRELVTREK